MKGHLYERGDDVFAPWGENDWRAGRVKRATETTVTVLFTGLDNQIWRYAQGDVTLWLPPHLMTYTKNDGKPFKRDEDVNVKSGQFGRRMKK